MLAMCGGFLLIFEIRERRENIGHSQIHVDHEQDKVAAGLSRGSPPASEHVPVRTFDSRLTTEFIPSAASAKNVNNQHDSNRMHLF